VSVCACVHARDVLDSQGRGSPVTAVVSSQGGAWATARVHGVGVHTRARVLASQGRSAAIPCAGHQHPGPAARRGGEGRRRLRGTEAARWVPAQEWHQGR
jgi:hypothetical protein